MKTRTKTSGFFIVEILIVLLIVGILAVALLPNLTTYVQRAKFADNITAASAMKHAVELCMLNVGGTTALPLGACAPLPINYPTTSNVANVVVDAATGKITANSAGTTVFTNGPFTYEITPTYTANTGSSGGGVITWAVATTSTCIAAGLC